METKFKKVTIKVNERELLALEDYIWCYNVCNQHKGSQTEEEFDLALRTCPNCKAKEKRIHNLVVQIESRLWHEFMKDSKSKGC